MTAITKTGQGPKIQGKDSSVKKPLKKVELKTQTVTSRVWQNLADNSLTNNRVWNISNYKFIARTVSTVAILALAAGAFYGVWVYFGLAAGALTYAAAVGTTVLGAEVLTLFDRANTQLCLEKVAKEKFQKEVSEDPAYQNSDAMALLERNEAQLGHMRDLEKPGAFMRAYVSLLTNPLSEETARIVPSIGAEISKPEELPSRLSRLANYFKFWH